MSCHPNLGRLARAVLGAALATSLGCAKVAPNSAAGAGGSTGTPGSAGAAGTTATTGGGGTSGSDAGNNACTPTVTTCTPAGGQYCGKIGNGCSGGKLECGACPGDGVCSLGLCLGGPSCKAIT